VRRGGIVPGGEVVEAVDLVLVGPSVDLGCAAVVEPPVGDTPDAPPPELGVPLEQLARLAVSGRQS
jgi:hypothetical protein